MQPGQELAHVPSHNQGALTAKPTSHHMHVTLRVTPPTSTHPTLSRTQNLRANVQKSFLRSAQYDVTKSAL